MTGGIPDFVLVTPQESTNPFLHRFGKVLAPLYKSPFWFPIMLKRLGGWDAPTLGQIVESVGEKIGSVDGRVLDVATGTGTYGRHVAGKRRAVYGIDISLEMLRKGQQFVEREGVDKMSFARADGEAVLPIHLFCRSFIFGSMFVLTSAPVPSGALSISPISQFYLAEKLAWILA